MALNQRAAWGDDANRFPFTPGVTGDQVRYCETGTK